MIDIEALFQETRVSLGGAALVTFEWWARTSKLAIDAQDWPTALDRLARMSDLVHDHADAQTALLALELMCCLRGNLPGRVEVAINRWTPGSSTALLRSVMVEAVATKNQAALMVAKQVTAKAPSFGFGWAAQAEIQEQRQAWSEAAKSWTFAETDLGSRARIRAGIASLRAGDIHTGRLMLRDLAVGPEVFDWVVLGWASSRFWTDRLRAYDMMEDAFAADKRAEPNAPRSLTQLRELLTAVIEQLPLTLTAIEHERLSDLVGLLDPLEQASATQRLNQRLELLDPHSAQDDVVEADTILAAFHGEATSGVAASLVTQAREGELDLELLDAMLELPVHEQAFLIAVWLGLEHYTNELEKRYLAWLADARRPECGWLTVAERLFVVKAHEAGIATLKRAASASDKTPQDQYERVLEHAVSYVTQHGTAADMRWWLELTAPD